MTATMRHLHQIEEQLTPLYYGITLLGSRVEESHLDVRERCDQAIKSLLERYKFVEHQVYVLSSEANDSRTPDFTEVESGLKDLLKQFEVVGRWVWVVTSD